MKACKSKKRRQLAEKAALMIAGRVQDMRLEQSGCVAVPSTRATRQTAPRPIEVKQQSLNAHMSPLAMGITSGSTAIQVLAALKALRAAPGARNLVCVLNLACVRIDVEAMKELTKIMAEFTNLVSINLGEQEHMPVQAWKLYIAALNSDETAVVCTYVCDRYGRRFCEPAKCAIAGQAGYNRRKVWRNQGKRGRRETQALAHLAAGNAAAARKLVPWRDAAVVDAILASRQPNLSAKWAKPFWYPKKTWSFVS